MAHNNVDDGEFDARALGQVSRYIDRLHMKRAPQSLDFFEMEDTDSETMYSMEQFISKLGQDDEGLAGELNNIVHQGRSFDSLDGLDIRPETLTAIGQYIDALAKSKLLAKELGAASTAVKPDATPTADNRETTLRSISNHIDLTAAASPASSVAPEPIRSSDSGLTKSASSSSGSSNQNKVNKSLADAGKYSLQARRAMAMRSRIKRRQQLLRPTPSPPIEEEESPLVVDDGEFHYFSESSGDEASPTAASETVGTTGWSGLFFGQPQPGTKDAPIELAPEDLAKVGSFIEDYMSPRAAHFHQQGQQQHKLEQQMSDNQRQLYLTTQLSAVDDLEKTLTPNHLAEIGAFIDSVAQRERQKKNAARIETVEVMQNQKPGFSAFSRNTLEHIESYVVSVFEKEGLLDDGSLLGSCGESIIGAADEGLHDMEDAMETNSFICMKQENDEDWEEESSEGSEESDVDSVVAGGLCAPANMFEPPHPKNSLDEDEEHRVPRRTAYRERDGVIEILPSDTSSRHDQDVTAASRIDSQLEEMMVNGTIDDVDLPVAIRSTINSAMPPSKSVAPEWNPSNAAGLIPAHLLNSQRSPSPLQRPDPMTTEIEPTEDPPALLVATSSHHTIELNAKRPSLPEEKLTVEDAQSPMSSPQTNQQSASGTDFSAEPRRIGGLPSKIVPERSLLAFGRPPRPRADDDRPPPPPPKVESKYSSDVESSNLVSMDYSLPSQVRSQTSNGSEHEPFNKDRMHEKNVVNEVERPIANEVEITSARRYEKMGGPESFTSLRNHRRKRDVPVPEEDAIPPLTIVSSDDQELNNTQPLNRGAERAIAPLGDEDGSSWLESSHSHDQPSLSKSFPPGGSTVLATFENDGVQRHYLKDDAVDRFEASCDKVGTLALSRPNGCNSVEALCETLGSFEPETRAKALLKEIQNGGEKVLARTQPMELLQRSVYRQFDELRHHAPDCNVGESVEKMLDGIIDQEQESRAKFLLRSKAQETKARKTTSPKQTLTTSFKVAPTERRSISPTRRPRPTPENQRLPIVKGTAHAVSDDGNENGPVVQGMTVDPRNLPKSVQAAVKAAPQAPMPERIPGGYKGRSKVGMVGRIANPGHHVEQLIERGPIDAEKDETSELRNDGAATMKGLRAAMVNNRLVEIDSVTSDISVEDGSGLVPSSSTPRHNLKPIPEMPMQPRSRSLDVVDAMAEESAYLHIKKSSIFVVDDVQPHPVTALIHVVDLVQNSIEDEGPGAIHSQAIQFDAESQDKDTAKTINSTIDSSEQNVVINAELYGAEQQQSDIETFMNPSNDATDINEVGLDDILPPSPQGLLEPKDSNHQALTVSSPHALHASMSPSHDIADFNEPGLLDDTVPDPRQDVLESKSKDGNNEVLTVSSCHDLYPLGDYEGEVQAAPSLEDQLQVAEEGDHQVHAALSSPREELHQLEFGNHPINTIPSPTEEIHENENLHTSSYYESEASSHPMDEGSLPKIRHELEDRNYQLRDFSETAPNCIPNAKLRAVIEGKGKDPDPIIEQPLLDQVQSVASTSDSVEMPSEEADPPGEHQKNLQKGKEAPGRSGLSVATDAASAQPQLEEARGWQDSQDILQLATLLTGSRIPSNREKERVSILVHFSFPFVDGRPPSAHAVSEIMRKADKLGLPLDAADRFLSLAQTAIFPDDDEIAAIDTAPSDEMVAAKICSSYTDIDSFIRHLISVARESPRNALSFDASHAFEDPPAPGKVANIKNPKRIKVNLDHAAIVSAPTAASILDDLAKFDIQVNTDPSTGEGDQIEVEKLFTPPATTPHRKGATEELGWRAVVERLSGSWSMNSKELGELSVSSEDGVEVPPAAEEAPTPPIQKEQARSFREAKRPPELSTVSLSISIASPEPAARNNDPTPRNGEKAASFYSGQVDNTPTPRNPGWERAHFNDNAPTPRNAMSPSFETIDNTPTPLNIEEANLDTIHGPYNNNNNNNIATGPVAKMRAAAVMSDNSEIFDNAMDSAVLSPASYVASPANNTYNSDIAVFWSEQEKGPKTRFGYPAKTVASLEASCSMGSNSNRVFSIGSSTLEPSRHDLIEDDWITRRSMAMYGTQRSNGIWDLNSPKEVVTFDVEPPEVISAVVATARFFHKSSSTKRSKYFPATRQWKATYVDRTQGHTGYLGVHAKSLFYATSSAVPRQHTNDGVPWENRQVKQRFLYESSVSFCKNWFGVLVPHGGNRVRRQPVCRPKSMPMPIKASDWSEEWYQKPWAEPLMSNLSHDVDGANTPRINPHSIFPVNMEDEVLFDNVPECGRIRNVKLKIGEKLSRLTPEWTSSLRRSRWRKKHFPRGSFPYK